MQGLRDVAFHAQSRDEFVAVKQLLRDIGETVYDPDGGSYWDRVAPTHFVYIHWSSMMWRGTISPPIRTTIRAEELFDD